MLNNQETLLLRRYADIFASCNKNVYDEVVKFEKNFVRSHIQNWKEMSSKSVDLILRRHTSWADLLGHFNDITAVLEKEKLNEKQSQIMSSVIN